MPDVETQIHKPNFPFNMESIGSPNEISNTTLEPKLQQIQLNNFDYMLKAAWYKGLVIDHIIPKGLSNKLSIIKKVLRFDENLRLVHNECHKKKTTHDRKMYQTFNKYLKSGIKLMVESLDKKKRKDLFGSRSPSRVTLVQLPKKIKDDIIQKSMYC